MRRNERAAVRDNYAEHPLWLLLQTPARKVEGEMKLFRLSAEELFMETVRILDDIKENPKDASIRMQGLWDEVFCDMRDLDTADAQEEELALAATEVVFAVMFTLSVISDALYTKLTAVLMCQLVERDASDTDHLQKEYAISMIRMGEERLRSFIADYMQSDEWLSSEIEDLLENVPKEEAATRVAESFPAIKIAENKSTSVVVVLSQMYRAGWFVNGDGSKLTNRDAAITAIMRAAFSEEVKNIGQLLNSAKNRTYEGLKYYFKELTKD